MDYLSRLGFVETTTTEREIQIIQKYVNFKMMFTKTCSKMHDLTRIIGSREAYECFLQNYEEGQIAVKEFFYCMALNRNCRLLGIMKVSEGGLNGTVADIRIIVKFLIDVQASATIICHNHPSGNLQPSESDKDLTKRFGIVLKICDIELNDHIIITPDDYYSMRDHGDL